MEDGGEKLQDLCDALGDWNFSLPVSTSAISGTRCSMLARLLHLFPASSDIRERGGSLKMATDSSKWPGEWHPAQNDVALASEAPDPAHLADFKTRLLASKDARGISNLMHIDLNRRVSRCLLSKSINEET